MLWTKWRGKEAVFVCGTVGGLQYPLIVKFGHVRGTGVKVSDHRRIVRTLNFLVQKNGVGSSLDTEECILDDLV
jgi:hypothetical protein